MSTQSLCLSLFLIPFLGFVINGVGFNKISKSLAGVVGTLASAASFVCTLLLFNGYNGTPQKVKFFDWITAGSTQIGFSFQIDALSLTMLLIITGIGTLIHLYSFGYMHHDAGKGKFFAFLNLFMFSMILLVAGSNFLVMFIGWEGVGLCSYLLIGFWNKNSNYADAARKAFIMNRIGDLGFLIGMFLIYQHFGSLEFSEVFSSPLLKTLAPGLAVGITACLFIGATGKSAQIPLYTWLPDAMAGPTPVSALIHAATMVTAGIYMVTRSNVLFSMAPQTMEVIAIIGLATALMAASIGLFQNDIKKVLAYSTVSQLGYMFLGLGVMAYDSSMFHVMTHAFFKALLFLGAGSVIHAMSDEQDIRNMGGLRKHLPITFWTFLLGTIAISGIPPFSGFFSKDEILMHVFAHNKLMWALAVAGSVMTSFYMFRLLFLTFLGEFRGTQKQKDHLHESPLTMTLPLMILAVLSVVGGLFNFPEIFGGHAKLAGFLGGVVQKTEGHAIEHSTELALMGVSTLAAVLSLVAAYVVFVSKKTLPAEEGQLSGFKALVYDKYRIDELYQNVVVNPLKNLSVILADFFEQKVIGGLGQNAEFLVNFVGGQVAKVQNGRTSLYLFLMVAGILAVFFNSLGKEFIDGLKALMGMVESAPKQ